MIFIRIIPCSMGYRFLLINLFCISFLLFGASEAAFAKDHYINYDKACQGGILYSSDLLQFASIPPGLLDKGRWVSDAGLEFSNTSHTAVISGINNSNPYVIGFSLHNGDKYIFTITAPVTANTFSLLSGGSTDPVLLGAGGDYPVALNVNPEPAGSSYAYYYQNVETGSVTTHATASPSAAWSFDPVDDQPIYSAYSVVTHTVSGQTCRSMTNAIEISKNLTLKVVGGGSVCQASGTFTLEVLPYDPSFNYVWTLPSGSTSTGRTRTVNLSNPSQLGNYTVRAYSMPGNSLVATSDPVTVGAYALNAAINPAGTQPLCEGMPLDLTGSATHSVNLDYRWVRNGVDEALISSGPVVNSTLDASDGGEFVFRVQETSNPLCYATSLPTNVELTIAAAQMPVTGTSACEGSSISNISLGNSQVGVTYRLMYNDGSGAVMVQEWMSEADGQTHTFSSVSAVGTYTVEATGCSGVVQMNGGPFVISALPNETLPVVLSGTGCEGDSHTVTVQGSEAGVSYQLFRGATAASLATTSTGGDLIFSGVTTAGDYTVRATRNGCTVTLDQDVRIGVVPAAQIFSPTTACAGTPFTLTLANSEAGVQYTIYNAANASLYSLNSGGGPLSFTVNQPVGTYTIVAQNTDNCTRDIGSFTLQAPPITTYSLQTDVTPACAVNGPHTIRLSNSQPGFIYRLLRGATVVSSVTAPAAGGPLDLASTSVAGTYTVEVSNGGCMLPMPTSLTIVAQPNDIPVVAGDYCDGDDVEVRLNTSQNGAIYRLYRDNQLYASEVEVTGTGGAIVFADKFTPGTYTVGASFVSGACERIMTGQVVVNALPNVEINPFSDHYCADAGTVTIGGRPQVGTNDWWVSGFATNPTWFTESGSSATINVIDLLDTQLGASDRVSLTFNYHYQDPVTGCEASASELMTFVDDQSDNLNFQYRMAATDPWSNFAGDLVTCQTVTDILLQALFIDTNAPTASGVFTTNAPTGSITNSGTGDEGAAIFHPSVAGNGLWAVTYTYVDPASGCEADITYNIQVGTTLSLHGLSAQYCADNNVDQEWYGLVNGGELIVAKDGGPTESVWLLDPSDRYLFNPQAKGAGDYEITYRFTSDPGGANECVNEITQDITVRADLDATFDTDDGRRIYCLTNGPVDLLPAPVAGSSYTGPGVGMGVFNPALAGVGTHRITRTVQDGFCSASEWIDVEVVAPDVPVVLDQYEFCYNETGLFPVEAGDMPVVGGVYSRDQADKNVDYTFRTDAVNALFRFQADGVTRDYASTFTVSDGDTPIYFDPSRVPAIGGSDLSINIYLEYDSPVDEGGCKVYTVQPILVKSVQAVNFGTTEPMEFCQNTTPVIMEGRFSGSGTAVGSGYFTADFPMDNEVDGPATGNNGRALFDPSLVTPTSAYQITFNYENPNGCISTRTKSFEIKAAPIKQRVTPVDPNGGIYCQGSGGVTIGLQGTQIDVRYILQKDGVDVDAAVQFIEGQLPGNTPRIFPNPITEPGVYTVRAIMIGIADGCDAQMEGSVIVDEKVVVGVLENKTHETCAGSNDGSLEFSAYGGVAPYTFTLSNGDVSASGLFTGLADGTYSVNIEDAAGCDVDLNNIVINPGNTINISSSDEKDVVCFGESNGTFTVTATGLPSGNYEFLLSGSATWVSNGTGKYIFSNLPAGTYDVTVRDADNPGCQTVMATSVVITQPTEAVYMDDFDITDITCSLDAEGEIEVMAAGGHAAGGFNYVLYREVSPGFWVNIAASPASVALGTSYTFSTLFAGNYRIVATDSEGCSVTEHYTVDGPASLPTITLSGDEIVHVSQPGLSDGSIQIAITGGQDPYNIVWTEIDALGGTPVGAPLTPDVYRQENLSAGFYRVTVLDDNGCDDVLEAEILDNAVSAFDLIYTSVNPGPCYGSSNGRINLRAVGGITPYLSLTLTNTSGIEQTPHSAGNSFANYENLPAGNYTATVVDSRGVSLSETIELTQPSAPVAVSHTFTDATCFGENGNLVFSATGGTPIAATAPAPDYYNFTILPSSGIAISGEIEVGEIIDVQADLPATQQLPAGTYQLTVTDAVSCFAVHNFTISEPQELTIQVVDRQHNLCHGASDGSITVAVDGRPGGTAYDFEWERYDVTIPDWVPYATGSSGSISNLAAGTYRVKATETAASSCESEFSGAITIGQPVVALNVVATPNDISTCNGDASGSVRLSVTGGTAPYTIAYGTQTISWNGLNDYVVTGLVAGTYDFTISDDNGCFVEESAVIDEPALFEASVSGSGITCETPNTGWIDLNVSGGVDANGAAAGGFAYQVRVIRQENNQVFHNQLYSDPALPISVTGLQQGTYTIRVWDANSTAADRCEQIFEIELRNMVINANIVHPTCSGLDNGSIEAIVTGGSGDFSYAWTGPGTFTSTLPLIDNLEPGTYKLTVTDNIYGCVSALRTYTIDYNYTLAVTTIDSDVSCFGGNDGSSTAMPTGGTAPYFYLWEEEVTPGTWTPLTNTATLSNRAAGTYRVTVTDANGCEEVSANVMIGEPADFSVASITYNRETVSCNGGADGSFTVNMDRPGNFEYSIDAVNWQILPTFEGLAPGSYRISVRDRVRDLSHPSPYCAKYEVETATILDATPVVITLDNQVDVACYGEASGELRVVASGGTAPNTYQWFVVTGTGNIPLAGETSASVTDLVAGSYFVQVKDNNLCLTTSEVYTLTEPGTQLVVSEFNNQPVSAYDGNDGSITVAITGGTPGYSIVWTGIDYEGNDVTASLTQNVVTLNNLKAGVYIATVTDNVGCTDDVSITVSQPGDALTLSEISVHPQPCNGASNGSFELTAAGGALPYTFTLIRNPGTDVPVTSVSGNKATFANLAAGFYTARVQDDNGNVAELTNLELIQPDPVEIYNFAAYNISCFGADDGRINFSIRGGTPHATNGYAYILRPENGPDIVGNGELNILVTNLVPDTYILRVYDETKVCFAEQSFTITEPDDISILETLTPASCNGDSDGSIRIEVSGGASGAFGYSWELKDEIAGTWSSIAGSNTAWLQNLAAGTYRVVVTDLGSSCSVTSDEFVLAEPDVLVITASPGDVNTCRGDNSGRIALQVEGGTAPYVIDYGIATLIGAGPEFFIENLPADTYTLIVRDRGGSGCQDLTTVIINEPAEALSVTIPVVSISCDPVNGESFSVSFDISGGVGISNGTDDEFSYFIEVTNLLTSGKKTKTVTATIDQPVSVNLDDLSLTAGDYRVIVSDLQAASSAACAAVEQTFSYKTLSVLHSISDESCPGAYDGRIDLSISGGSGNYNYLWNKDGVPMSETTQDLSGLEAGLYTVTVTDNGEPGRCAFSRSYTVGQAKQLLVEGSVQNVSCFGGNNGAIRIHGVANATMPLTYFWNGSSVAGGAELTGLTAGDYSVEILDGEGCRVQETFSITQPTVPLDAILSSELDCLADSRSITVSASGGTGPYTYQWMGPGAYTRVGDGATIEGITNGGTWQVEVTDARGCKLLKTIEIDGKLTLDAELTDISCNGGSGGNIVLNVGGGSGSYTYTWTKDGAPYAETTKDLSNLGGGVYEVVVRDLLQSCSGGGDYSLSLSNLEIMEPAAFVVEGNITNNECYGSAEGRINIHTVTGGTAPYRYEWTTGDGSGIIQGQRNQSGLRAGIYYLRVIDSKDCSSELFDFEVTELDELGFVLDVDDTNCLNENRIEITNPVGGSGTYRFFWNGPGTEGGTELLKQNLPGGTYTITMVDMGTTARCNITKTEVLTKPLLVSSMVLPETCSGMANGAITLDVKGGIAPYTFAWETAPGIIVNDRNQAALQAGSYTVHVTDSRSTACTVDLVVEVPLLHDLELQAAIDDIECYGGNNGAIYLSVLNGSGSYSYHWTKGGFNATTKDLSGLEAGTYSVVVRDEVLGCTVSGVYEVRQPLAPITISVGVVTHNSCFGDNNGAIPVTVSGGTAPYSYLWNGPGNLANPSLEDQIGLRGGNYYLSVTDARGCVLSNYGPITVNEPSAPVSISLVEVTPVTALNAGDGTITIQISGGSGSYTSITWTHDGGDDMSAFEGLTYASGLSGGTYTINAQDANGCDAEALEVYVYEPGQALELEIDKQASGPCFSSANGKIFVTVKGGELSYQSLTLSDGTGTIKQLTAVNSAIFDNLASGDYTVTVIDAFGNNVSQNVRINEVTAPLAVTATVTSQVDCRGASSGVITARVTGGIPNSSGQYRLILAGGPAGTSTEVLVLANVDHTFINLPKGTYSVRVIDDSNVLRVKHDENDLQDLFGDEDFDISDDCTSAQSGLIIHQPEAVVHLSVEPGSDEVCAGVTPRLVAATSGWDFADGDLRITLSNSESFVITAASQVLTLTTLPVNDFTTYTIVSVTSATVAGCEKGEGAGLATLIRHERPTASLSGTTTVCAGETTYLNLQLTGTAPWQVSYSDGTSTFWINDITTPTYQLELSPAANTTYTLLTVADANCTGTASGTATVTVPVVSMVEFVGDASRDICAGAYEILEVAFDPASNGPWQLTYSAQPLVGGLPSGTPVVRTVTVDAAMFNAAGNYEISVAPAQTVRYRLEGVVSGGCAGTVDGLPIDVLVGHLPAQPGAITGPVEVCQGATVSFSVPALPGVSHYVWTLPNGVEVSGGYSLTTTFATDAVSGRLSVYAVNSCGDGPLQYMDIIVNPLPDASAAVLEGPDNICQGSKGVVFRVEGVNYADTYIWVLPVGTILSGQGTAQIVVDFPDDIEVFNGLVSVQAVNSCGDALDEVSKAFTVRPLPVPNAGVDQLSLCGSAVTLNATPLTAADLAAGAVGRWLALPVEGSADLIADDTNPNVTVSGLSRGDVRFRWVVTSQYGCESYDEVTVRNNQLVVNASASSASVCHGTVELVGTPPPIAGVSGQWTAVHPVGSSAYFNNAASANVLVSDMPVGENRFRWTLTQNGCESYSEVTVMNSQADEAVILGPEIIPNCGENITIQAVAPRAGWGSGLWSLISGYAQIVSPTSAITVVQDIAQGDVILEWRVSNGHCSDAATVTIRNNKLTVDAGPDQELCSSNTQMAASAVPAGASGSWHVISGFAGFADGSSPTATVSNLARGRNELEWRINNNGCISSDFVVINNNMATVATVGSAQVACDLPVILSGNAVDATFAEIGYWSVVKGAGNFVDANDPNTEVQGMDFGENIYRWTINNNNKCSTYADLTVINRKVEVDAGKDEVVCNNIVTVRGSLVPAGATGQWRAVSGGSGSVIVADPTKPHIAQVSLGQGSNRLVWAINNQGCYSEDEVVIVNSRPYPVDGGDPVRYVTSPEVYMNAVPVGSGMTGMWMLISGNGTIANPNDPGTLITDLGRGENLFHWIVTNGNCSAFDQVLIVNGDVVDAEAGRPQTLCGNFTTLEANDPQGAIGQWSVISGTARFENPSDPKTRVFDLSPDDNVLRWTIRYGSSEHSSSSSDDVTITNNQPDQAMAGNDVVFCNDEYQLRGNAPRTVPYFMGTPKWTIISGGGEIEDAGLPTSWVRNLAQGENILVYSITKDKCERTDTVKIINGLPSEPYAGEDDAVCDDNYLLNPSTPVYGTARWRPGSTGGAQFEGNLVYGLAQGANELIYEIYTEWCTLEDRITITNNKPSASFAGNNRDVCVSTHTLGATGPLYGVGSWSLVAGSGTIDPADINNPNAVVSGLGSGSNRFRWTVDNNGCTSSSEVEIRYNFIEADAGDDNTICEDFTQLRGSNPMVGTGTWGIKGGSGSAVFENPNDPLTKVSGLDRGENVLTWTVSNVNCTDVDEVVITNNMPSIADAGADQALCEPTSVLQGSEDVVGQGRWTIRSGSATLTSTTHADPYEDPSAQVSGLTFGDNILRWTITNEGCVSFDDVVLQYNKVIANAGVDRSECADEVTLSAVNPTPGTGMWSIPGGQGSAQFVSPGLATTRVTNLGRGSNTLRWTVSYRGCQSYDDVIVNNNLPSTPYAGNEQSICSDSYVMDASAPTLGSSGRWTVITGSAVFEDETLYNTPVSSLANGDNIFVWTTQRVEGCTLEDQVIIRNHSVSEPNAGTSYEEVCSSTFSLKAATPDYGTGIWSFVQGGGNISDVNNPRATISTLGRGTNILRWTISQGSCVKTSDVTIVNNSPTRPNAGPDIEDCKDEQTLDANVPMYYDKAYWERISGYGDISDVNDPKSSVSNLGFGANEFQWTITKGECSLSDRVVIFNKIPDKAFAGSDQPAVCENYTVLNANDPETGLGKWTVIKGSGTFDDETLYNTIVRNVGFGENIYRWEVAYGECGTFDEVAVISNKTEAYAGENQVVYSPEAILNANNAGELDSRWIIVGTSTAALADANFFNTAVSNLNEGINTFRWEINVNGCITYDLVSIDYRPVPDAGFITDVDAGCYPLRVLFTNYSVGGSVYMWDFGDGSTSGDRNPVHTYTEPGTYNVKLVAPGPDGNDGVFNKTIEVFEHPVADFTVNPQIVYIPGDNARFYDLSTDAVSWLWDFGDGTSSNERNPAYQYSEEGVYDVTLIVSNSNGCADTLTVEEVITAEAQGYLVFPNAFKPRPGGASGPGVDPSSEYVVVFKPAFSDVDEFTLEIFNRWGQRIFKTNDINTGWDGMYEGQMAPQAVYVYLATGKYVNGREFRKTGSVLLVR